MGGQPSGHANQSTSYFPPNQPPASQLGFFTQISAPGTNALQPATASPFGVGLMPTPQGAPMTGLVIGQQATGWGQPTAANQMKGFKAAGVSAGGAANIASQLGGTPLAGVTAGHMPQSFQMPAPTAQNTFGMGPNSSISEFNVNVAAASQLQQAGPSSAGMKWAPAMMNQSDKSMQGGQASALSNQQKVRR